MIRFASGGKIGAAIAPATSHAGLNRLIAGDPQYAEATIIGIDECEILFMVPKWEAVFVADTALQRIDTYDNFFETAAFMTGIDL